MEEKLVDKIVKNYSSLIDKLEIYSNSEKNSEDKSLKELASYIASIIKNTDFENKILKTQRTYCIHDYQSSWMGHKQFSVKDRFCNILNKFRAFI